jgi:hypothetical protein
LEHSVPGKRRKGDNQLFMTVWLEIVCHSPEEGISVNSRAEWNTVPIWPQACESFTELAAPAAFAVGVPENGMLVPA